MEWNGKAIETVGDLNDTICKIRHLPPDEAQAEASRFMEAYRADNEHADVNIGYITGYHDPTTMRELQELFNVSHPIFGRSQPTAEDAFDAGVLMGSGITPEPLI